MSIINKLTEGIVSRDLGKEGAALLSKWERTGLLEGLDKDRTRQTMARLLENQAKELLREASTMASGDVEGFAAVAFPIVRRVFGNLIANDLVSVQPMSLPSGLIFFMDFSVQSTKLDYSTDDSLYGGGRLGQEITGGVLLTGDNAEAGFYALNQGYSSPTSSVSLTFAAGTAFVVGNAASTDKGIRFDPDLASGSYAQLMTVTLSAAQETDLGLANGGGVVALSGAFADTCEIVRRLSTYDSATRKLTMVAWRSDASPALSGGGFTVTAPWADAFDGTPAAGSTNALGAVVGTDTWGLENTEKIPEIDIKVDSVSVTAITKKLKAKWTPELGQDLNAYHNLDAEVELTSILSEQIALEIDREILADLVDGATAGTYYWSRSPGLFVNRSTGAEIGASSAAPDFTGTVSEWYETLVETINDVSAQIHRKTLRGGANFLVVGPEVANILEFTSGFRAKVSHEDSSGQVGAVNVGSLSKKWDVVVDPYFPRNVVLVGRKGSSFLESGYVYSPYVPLQVTPTIFGTEDFVPRKGVMTRYAKKMVRPDMYGVVVVRGLLGEAGATS